MNACAVLLEIFSLKVDRGLWTQARVGRLSKPGLSLWSAHSQSFQLQCRTGVP